MSHKSTIKEEFKVSTRHYLIKIGIALLLFFGFMSILFLGFLLFTIYTSFPELDIFTKNMAAAVILITAFFVTIILLTTYQSLIRTMKLEKEVERIEEEISISNKYN